MGLVLLGCQILAGAVFADYITGYVWDWESDYMPNMLLSTPANPAADSEGSAGVWTYAYNVNDASTATIRNTGSSIMQVGLKNGTSYVWSQNPPATYSTAAYFRATPSTSTMALIPGPDVDVNAQLCQLIWTAPIAATIKISGDIVNIGTTGNGILWYLDAYQSGAYTGLSSGSVGNLGTTAVDVTISVSQGDQIIFSADANGGSAGDLSEYNVTYEIVPEPASVGFLGIGACGILLLRRLSRS